MVAIIGCATPTAAGGAGARIVRRRAPLPLVGGGLVCSTRVIGRLVVVINLVAKANTAVAHLVGVQVALRVSQGQAAR